MYTRGPAEDYDSFAKISGDQGWSWKSLQPYFRKNEKWTPPADHHNTTGQFDPKVHSFTGINSVSLSGSPTAIDGRVIQATTQLGPTYKFNLDMNSGTPLGIGTICFTISWRFRDTDYRLTLQAGYKSRSTAQNAVVLPHLTSHLNL